MSLFCILHSAAGLTPEGTLAAAFPTLKVVSEPPRASIATEYIAATSMVDKASPFAMELFGIIPKTDIYFRLDTFHSVEARTQLATAISSFLSATKEDVVVQYLDDIVLKRIGPIKVCVSKYVDMLPSGDPDWTLIQQLDQPL